MWYKNKLRRHLCDMHIDDWNEDFLSQLSPEEYVKNLKTAKIENAMLYFQSHVGLCYYPTKTGKMHNDFVGKEDTMRKIAELCHNKGISVTGYYSLIYNNWASIQYPEWKIKEKSDFSEKDATAMEFADNSQNSRYGLCCPNNLKYREFVKEQIKEMSEYFKVDGMFYDMTFWPKMCYCESCMERWEKEVRGEIPKSENPNDEKWLLHMRKRREWIGEFAHWVTDITKELFGNISVEHNVAYSALPDATTANCEEVISACDYAGGDLYRDIYSHSFACKFYRNITKNQPFEYMISRCAPNLSSHTQIKSKDIMKSAVFLTTAHHGATLIIDAIDPVGTMDSRVYEQIGDVFDELTSYEPYIKGEMIEDVGIYYSLKSKFSSLISNYTNYIGTTTAVETMTHNNILCGVTGGYHDINKYKILVASCLTEEDSYDNKRIIDYVKNGGNLYFSGSNNKGLLKEFFKADVEEQTKEKVVYITPKESVYKLFEYYNKKYPLIFNDNAPITKGMKEDNVVATITLPYTHQDTTKFASIHSNPPGIQTDIPAMAVTKYEKGTVIWSALPIECMDFYDYRRIFINLLKEITDFAPTLTSDAPNDVEITLFRDEISVYVNTVLLNTKHTARKVEDFTINISCENPPKKVTLLPNGEDVIFEFDEIKKTISFKSENLKIFNMYKIELAVKN